MSDAMATAPLDKSGKTIRDMFAGVAPRYDFLNHLLSASLDAVWRPPATEVLGLSPGSPVLDLCCAPPAPGCAALCCGTGAGAPSWGRGGAGVAAAVFCVPMPAIARHKFARTD